MTTSDIATIDDIFQSDPSIPQAILLDAMLLDAAAKTKTKTVRAGWGGGSSGALQSGNSRAWTRGGDVD